MDSRDYVFAFPVNGSADVPADFEPPPSVSDLVAGLFLPQSEPDWLRRRAFPARILLLTRDGLWVVPHPGAMERRLFIPLRNLEALECGRILLIGWIGLRCGDVDLDLRYNRRCSDTVEKFLTKLKALWLSEKATQAELELPSRSDYGAALNVKFKYALETEMIGDDEPPLMRFFLPSVRRLRRRVFRYETWSAGDLVALTPRRLLWITDRNRGLYEPYGTVSRSAPLTSLAGVHPCLFNNEPSFECALRRSQAWRFPLAAGFEPEARNFADCIREILPFLNETGGDLGQRTCAAE
jgi:hypothetical protein